MWRATLADALPGAVLAAAYLDVGEASRAARGARLEALGL